MTLTWQACAGMVINPITSFRLSRQAEHYPGDLDSLWWSAVIHLSDGTSIDTFRTAIEKWWKENHHSSIEDELVIPPNQFQLVTVFARTELLKELNKPNKGYGVADVWLGTIVPKTYLNPEATQEVDTESSITRPTNGAVVTAVIDHGIAIAHDLFRDRPTSSRIEYAWIMGAPQKYFFGMLNKEQINALLAECTTDDLLDEDRFYAKTGQVDFAKGMFSTVSLRRSHGTHVAALAAGFPMQEKRTDRPIICAVLPPGVVEDTTGQNLLPDLLLALTALRIVAGDAPVVFNFSYGNFSGPHDGTGAIPRWLEFFFGGTNIRKRWLTLPAGNGNLARVHAKLEFKPQGREETKTETLDLVVLPDDRTASYVQMWMPSGNPNYASVRVTPPFGPPSELVGASEGECQSLVNAEGHEVAKLTYTVQPFPNGRGVITLSINATARLEGGADLAPFGRWKIETEAQQIEEGQCVEVWVQRDETLPGFPPGGRQAYFDDPGYQKFGRCDLPLAVDPDPPTSHVRRAGTLSGLPPAPRRSWLPPSTNSRKSSRTTPPPGRQTR